MNFLYDYLKGLLISLLPAVLLFCVVLFFIKDVFAVGTKAAQLLMYREVLFGAAWTFSILCLLTWLLGSLSLIYLKRQDILLGYSLGAVIQLIYLIALFQFLNQFWANA